MWNTPSGRPAACSSSASSTPPLTGVRGSGFSTTALPVASAGSDRAAGQQERKVERRDDADDAVRHAARQAGDASALGSTRPLGWVSIAAASGSGAAPSRSRTWPWAGCRRSRERSRSRTRRGSLPAARPPCGTPWRARRRAAQPSLLRRAWLRAQAARTSAGVASATPPIGWPVAGSITSSCPPASVFHSPAQRLAGPVGCFNSFMLMFILQ